MNILEDYPILFWVVVTLLVLIGFGVGLEVDDKFVNIEAFTEDQEVE